MHFMYGDFNIRGLCYNESKFYHSGVTLGLTGPPEDERHKRLGGRPAAPSPEASPCPRLRVAGLLPLAEGLDISSLGVGESLLLAREATGDEVPSHCIVNKYMVNKSLN